MKEYEEMCKIIQHIATHPKEIVDYLTVSDFLQMREHVWICGACSDAVENTIAKDPKTGKLDVNFGNAGTN